MKSHPALLALAVGAFGIGLTEFAPMGFLPLIAADLRVSIPAAGLLISGYAMGVMVSAPAVTILGNRLPQRTLLAALAGVFTIGNLLSGLADTYTMLLAARMVTAINHGAFFGVGANVAASLAGRGRDARGVAVMFSGLTLATLAGVPAASAIAELIGWRAPFLIMTAIGLATLIALLLTLPSRTGTSTPSVMCELRELARPQVWGALFVTALSSSAMFVVYTYIAPILRQQTHSSASLLATMLVLYGLGLTVGNWIGGYFADRSVRRTLLCSLCGLALILLALAAMLPNPGVTALLIFLWGVASFALVPPLQVQVMSAAGSAPNLASSVNIGAFNLGNAIGAAIGAGVIQAGFDYRAVPVAGALMALLAFGGASWSFRKASRDPSH